MAYALQMVPNQVQAQAPATMQVNIPMAGAGVAPGLMYGGAYQPEVTPYGRLAELKYVEHYPVKVCMALFRIAPNWARQIFGSLENCINIFRQAADIWFDKWLANWPVGMAMAAIAAARGGYTPAAIGY